MTIGMGDNAPNDEMRSTYWTAIEAGKTLEGFPTARKDNHRAIRGQES